MKKKKVVIGYIAFVLVFACQVIDVFFVHSRDSLFGGDVASRIAGIAIVIVASVILKFNVRKICFKKYGWFAEMLYGFFLAAVPVGICLGAEFLFLKYVRGFSDFTINISFPNVSSDMGLKSMLTAVGLYVFTVFLESLFKELFFRGFLISQFHGKYGVNKSIFIQTIFYTLMLVPMIVHSYMTGRFAGYGMKMTVYIIAGNLLLDFISGIKWGLFYKVNGTVWMQVADHFVNNMLLTCFCITKGVMPVKWFVLYSLAVQAISFVMFIPLYFNRDKINEEISAEITIQRELAGMRVDSYSPSPARHFLENQKRTRQVEYAKKNNLPPPRDNRIKRPEDLENPISLSEMTEEAGEAFLKTIRNDGAVSEPEQSDDIASLKEEPSKMSKDYFGKMINKSMNVTDGDIKDEDNTESHEANEDNSAESSDNISKLVQEYFNKNFEKHTF